MSMGMIPLLKPKVEVGTQWETILMQDGSPGGPVHRGLHMVGFHESNIFDQILF